MSRFGSKATTRPERRETYHSQDQDPTEGHPEGVPEFPGALPGLHHYGTKHAVPVEHDLDVGPAGTYYGKGGMAHGVEAPAHHGGRPTARPQDRAEHGARELVKAETRTRPEPVPVYLVDMGGGTAPLQRAALRSVTVGIAGTDPQVLVPRNTRRSSVRLLNESSGYAAYASGAFAAAAAGSVSLPAGVAATGFDVTSAANAGGAVSGIVTVTGGLGGTMSWQYVFPDVSNNQGNLVIRFPQPVMPASPTVPITLSMPAIVGGTAGQLVLYGETEGPAVRILFDLSLTGGSLLPAGMGGYVEIDTQDEICAYCPAGGPAQVSVIEQYDVPAGG